MTQKELCKMIGLSETAITMLDEMQMDKSVYQLWKQEFDEDSAAFLDRYGKEEDFSQKILLFYVRYAYDKYSEMEDEHRKCAFLESLTDIAIWEQVYEKNYQKAGLAEPGWVCMSLKEKVIRLGRLQFEPRVLEEQIEADGRTIPAGAGIIEVHIPEGEPMTMEACRESFRRARDMFGEEYNGYHCFSWLLAPEVKGLLKENSNIVRFQNLFHVYRVNHLFPMAEERVFGKVLEDKNCYPEGTSLQRNLKKYTLEQGDIGIGEGVIFWEELYGL